MQSSNHTPSIWHWAAPVSAYRDLFAGKADASELHDLRAALQTGTPLGNARFKAEIETALQVKVGQTHRGRPKLKVALIPNESTDKQLEVEATARFAKLREMRRGVRQDGDLKQILSDGRD